MMKAIKCPICGSLSNRVLFKTKDYRYRPVSSKTFKLISCLDCQVVFTYPRFSEKEMDHFYPEDYYGNQKGKGDFLLNLQLITKRKLIDEITKKIKKGSFLDVGCGSGEFLLEMKKKGFDVVGIDVSLNACNLVEKKGIEVYNKSLLQKKFPVNSFDLVTFWHVFEHLREPDKDLKEVKRILKRDGILIIDVPNFDSFSVKLFGPFAFHLDVPRHFFHWTEEGLIGLLNRNGFKIIKIRSSRFDFPLALFKDLRNFLISKKIDTNFSKFLLILAFLPLLFLTIIQRLFNVNNETLLIWAKKI